MGKENTCHLAKKTPKPEETVCQVAEQRTSTEDTFEHQVRDWEGQTQAKSQTAACTPSKCRPDFTALHYMGRVEILRPLPASCIY